MTRKTDDKRENALKQAMSTNFAQIFGDARNNVGLLVWRIEKMAPVPIEASKIGKFSTGDSYIVLKVRS